MLRNASPKLLSYTRMTGPKNYSTRSYSSPTLAKDLTNLKLLAKRIVTGQKPSFPSAATMKIPDVNLRKIKTMEEYNGYLEFVKRAEDTAREVIVDVAKDTAKKALEARVALLMTFIALLMAADSDLDKLEDEINAEKKQLEKAIEELEEDEQIKKAALDELEKSYIGWMDWLNNTTEGKKLEVKTELVEIAEARKILLESVAQKQEGLASIDKIRKMREAERDELVLSVD